MPQRPSHKYVPSQQLPQSVNVKASESKLSKQRCKVTTLNDSAGAPNLSTVSHGLQGAPFDGHGHDQDGTSRFGANPIKQQKQISNINHLMRKRYSEKDSYTK